MQTLKKLGMGMTLCAAILGVGCGGGNQTGSNEVGKKDGAKITAEQLCAVLAQPAYENNSPFNGTACSGSTTFGAKRDTTSVAPSTGPSFSYAVFANEGKIDRVSLNMSKRADGGEFFGAVADSVAKAISKNPMPEKIRGAITSSYPDVTLTETVGPAGATLERSSTDNRYTLTFKF